MRAISSAELVLVSGGLQMYDGGGESSWGWGDMWDSLVDWFTSDSSANVPEGPMQVVVITAPRMSDAQKMAYDIQQQRELAPGCEFTMEINPTSTTVTASVTVALAPSGTGTASTTFQNVKRSWKCPPLEP